MQSITANILLQVQGRLKSLKSAEQQKLQQLGKSNPDCHKAVLYVRKNMPDWRLKGRFKYGIHEPALLTLGLLDMDQAVYVEKETGAQQLEAFVCEEAGEANDLMQELRSKFSKVSVIHGDLSKMSQFEGPRGERWRQRPPPQDLQGHSFVSYVSDMFHGPDAVRVHLFMHTSVFSTAVFLEGGSSEQISERFPELRKYYLGKRLNTCRKSKYSGLVSRGEEDISYYKAQRLRVAADAEETRGCEKQTDDFNTEIATNTKRLQKVGETVEENKKEMKTVKSEIGQIVQGRVDKQKLEISVKHKQELLEQLTTPTGAAFTEERVKGYRQKRREATLDLVRQMQSLQEDQAKGSLQAAEREMLYLKQFYLGQVYSENSSQLSSLGQELQEQEALLGPEEARLDVWKNRLRTSKDEAHGCTSDEVTEDPITKKPPPGYASRFEKIE